MNLINLPQRDNGALAPLAPHQARRISELRSRIDCVGLRKYQWKTAEVIPTAAERRLLNDRTAQIEQALRPASMTGRSDEISALLISMAAERASDSERLAILRIYLADLDGVPAFALVEGCRRYRQGEIGEGTFMPKAGKVRKEAMKIAQPYRDELADLKIILKAETPPKEESLEHRQAVIARYKKLMRPVMSHVELPPNEVARGEPMPPPREKTPAEMLALIPEDTLDPVLIARRGELRAQMLAEMQERHAAEGPCRPTQQLLATLGSPDCAGERQ